MSESFVWKVMQEEEEDFFVDLARGRTEQEF